MLQDTPENRLRVYLIWQPVLQSDNRASAERRTHEFASEEFVHFWDRSRFTGKLWQHILNRKAIPWDVYLLYDGSTQWEETPTRPDFWVRQLNHANTARFALKVKEMLGQTK